MSRNFSGAVEDSVGSGQFWTGPCSNLYFSRSIGPFQCLVSATYRVLLCCTCHFQSGSLFSVYFGFLCLQVSSVSNFRPDTGGSGGHFFRLTCWVVLRGGGSTANKHHWCVLGALAVSGHTGFAPAHGVCAFPVYTAQAPDCSAGELSNMGPVFCVLSRSELLRFRFSGTRQRHRLAWACVLCPS